MYLEVYTKSPWVHPIFGFLLSCLFFMHIYWFILMQKILFTFFTKGVAEDTVNKNASSDPALNPDGPKKVKSKKKE